MQLAGTRASHVDERRRRGLVILAMLLLAVSTAFPIAASLMQQTPARWIGVADGIVAFLLVAVGFTIVARAPRQFDGPTIGAAFRIYRNGASALLALIVLFFVAGDRINWMVLLIGLAWRSWLVAWVMPPALALWRGSGGNTVPSA